MTKIRLEKEEINKLECGSIENILTEIQKPKQNGKYSIKSLKSAGNAKI